MHEENGECFSLIVSLLKIAKDFIDVANKILFLYFLCPFVAKKYFRKNGPQKEQTLLFDDIFLTSIS